MILGATMAQDAGFTYHEKATYMLFPFALHCLDILASTIGLHFVRTKPGLPDYDVNYGPIEDPLDIMKRGYKVAISIGILGFIFLAFMLLHN